MVKGGKSKGNGSKASSTRSPASETPEQTKLTVVAAYPNPFPSFYANYALVTHTASEIFIDCALIAQPYNVNLEEAQVSAPVVARIILPPPVASGLITALQAQTEKQKNTAKGGTLVVPMPKPKTEGS